MTNVSYRDKSRKSFLAVLGTAALAGCGAAHMVPGGAARKPSYTNGICTTDGGCASGGGSGTGGGLGSDLSGLTIQQIQALTTNQIYGLTGSQIGTLTPVQIPVLTATQVAAFHGAQATAIFGAVKTAQQGAPPAPPTQPNPPPPPYTPSTPGSDWWAWVGGVIGGVIGGAVGGLSGNPVVVWFGAQGGALMGTVYGTGGASAQYNFWNSNDQAYESVNISIAPNTTNLDSDGYTVTGSFDSSSNTVTITVIPN